jgi:hypothetical protein
MKRKEMHKLAVEYADKMVPNASENGTYRNHSLSKAWLEAFREEFTRLKSKPAPPGDAKGRE